MINLSRREFIRLSAAASFGGATLDRRSRQTKKRRPHVSFPALPAMRVAVASWPFRAFIESPSNRDRDPTMPGMDLKDFAAYVSRKFNVHNIEPFNRHFSSTDEQYLSEFRKAVEAAGARVVNIAVDEADSIYDADSVKRESALTRRQKWIDVAQAINSPSVRVNIVRAGNTTAPDLERTVGSLRKLANYGAHRNVVVNLENDNLVSEDAFFLIKAIKKVNSPWLRALPDFCNSMLSGNADYNYQAVSQLFRHAYNICHVKEYEIGEANREYRIDLAKTFGLLKASNYHGYCSIEWEGRGSPEEGTRDLVAKAIRYLS